MRDDPVLRQYQAYPYPARNPAEEKRRLVTGSPSHLAEVNHYLFAGRGRFEKPFRALIAGGGTGDAAVMLGQQLLDAAEGDPERAGEVVYLDISEPSRAIAEARAAVRGLTNLRFITGAIGELPRLGLGRFDYIDCCGVLHHLEDPAAGLSALVEALQPQGGMGLMVYGEYGRWGVYSAQAMLRQLGEGLSLEEQIKLARRLLDSLPETHGLRLNRVVGDHKRSDAELVDLLLHPRDRAYKLPELLELLEGGGLRPAALIEPARYDPDSYLTDPVLRRRLAELEPLQRAVFAERLAGNMKTHIVYAVPRGRPESVARPDRLDAVPLLRDLDATALARSLQKDLTLKVEIDRIKFRFALPRLAPAILLELDGQRSLGEVLGRLRDKAAIKDDAEFHRAFEATYKALNGINRLLLRYPGAAA